MENDKVEIAVARLEEQNKTIFLSLARIETNLNGFIVKCDERENEQRELMDSKIDMVRRDNATVMGRIGIILWVIGGIITVLVGLILKVVKVI